MLCEDGIQFFSDKSILITGATGFLGKVIVEKILRTQPNVKKLYLLIRASDTTSILDRLHTEILQKDLFRVLREQHGENFDSFIAEKVAPIAGDSSMPTLGIATDELWHKIDAIIHVAATTRFNERYDVAFGTNTLGAMHIINFANMCSRLQILIHVSTAYVSGDKEGLISETLSEKRFDIDEERRLIYDTLCSLQSKEDSPKDVRHTMTSLGQQRAKFYGWPNTYTFTKAMAEMMIWKYKRDLAVVIVRPTMVGSTLNDPFPGWIEGFGSVSIPSIAYGKGLVKFMRADHECVLDMIPADMVTNCITAAMAANATKSGLIIYQVCSSSRNPVTFGELADLIFQYFNRSPWADNQGLVVKVTRPKITKSQAIFMLHLILRFLILMVLQSMDIISCRFFNMGLDKFELQLKTTYKMAQLFRPYICFQGIFDDSNTEKLRTWMTEIGIDKDGLNFDPRCIDWEDYLLNIQIPATVKYLF